ncbi:hypothetical protein [Scytonema sp. UIC 10036]|uniref:hypothetical protein n=1 Tax=Scytonema sp. UIC 10036 TaxID=2304196 RepID=UPI001FAA4A7C|nr:hypothetical protein [Scytonema sp. UIC 10036]
MPYVFDYFSQGDDSITTRTFGGMGLELAVVCHIVEMLGRTIKAESLGELQGATFTVMLPCYAASNFNEISGERLCKTYWLCKVSRCLLWMMMQTIWS